MIGGTGGNPPPCTRPVGGIVKGWRGVIGIVPIGSGAVMGGRGVIGIVAIGSGAVMGDGTVADPGRPANERGVALSLIHI